MPVQQTIYLLSNISFSSYQLNASWGLVSLTFDVLLYSFQKQQTNPTRPRCACKDLYTQISVWGIQYAGVLGEGKGNKKKMSFHTEKAITQIHGLWSPFPLRLSFVWWEILRGEVEAGRGRCSPSCVDMFPPPPAFYLLLCWRQMPLAFPWLNFSFHCVYVSF